MSLKRSSVDRGSKSKADESSAKVDRQDLWDELSRRVDDAEPFSPAEVAQAIGAPEAAVARQLLHPDLLLVTSRTMWFDPDRPQSAYQRLSTFVSVYPCGLGRAHALTRCERSRS